MHVEPLGEKLRKWIFSTVFNYNTADYKQNTQQGLRSHIAVHPKPVVIVAIWRINSRVQWFFKLTMLHVVLDRQKISKTILEKAFFFILWCYYLFSTFVLNNFKIGSSERWKFFSWNWSYRVSKSENFKLISKKQTCLSDKMPPKKVNIKKLFF